MSSYFFIDYLSYMKSSVISDHVLYFCSQKNNTKYNLYGNFRALNTILGVKFKCKKRNIIMKVHRT